MIDRNQIEHPVSEAFKRFQAEFEPALQSEVETIRSAVETIRRSNGKHIRPLLLLLTAKACGRVPEASVRAAVLLELLHTASLIHDDVVDETKQRRGALSLNAIHDNRVAVLVGDFILADSLMRALQLENLQIVGIMAKLCHDMAEGEIKQLENADKVILTEMDYFVVLEKKTAALLASCTQIGAITAGASAEVQKTAGTFGKLLGYCFQIRDDIFDYFEDSRTGKPSGNDLREGKVTLPLLYALEKASPAEKAPYMEMLLKKNFTPDHIAALLRFAREKGGIEYAEARMNEYREQAARIIRSTLPASEARDSLLLLADYLVERSR
ncbi:MAG: polyprenyl synthetase family protein [Tannerella sp.]|jgi:octaprenyl-diphosphate synthase|nr:polyprenyl synthetase family protein [Tannerella sp.]